MNRTDDGPVESEQLLPLWTWLLHGHLPVAHIVADLDELEAPESREPGDEGRGGTPRAHAAPVGRAKAA